jgi:outer membrane protein TolC
MTRRLTVLVLMLAGAAPASAAPADTLTLSLPDAVVAALRSNADVRVARSQVAQSQGRIREALANALPQVTGSLTYNRKLSSVFSDFSGDTTLGPLADVFSRSSFAAKNTWTADVQMSQLLWSGGRVGAALAGAKALRKGAEAGHRERQAEVTLRVTRSYLDAQLARESAAIAESALVQARAHLRQVELFRQQGTRAEFDLIQARVDAANEEPPVVAARSAAVLAMLDLKQLLDLPLERPVALVTPLRFGGDRVPVPISLPPGGGARPALAQADAQVEVQRQVLRGEKSGRWPNLTASALLSHQAFPQDVMPTQKEFVRAMDASVKLEWPLFQGFRTFGSVQRASAELEQAEAQRQQLRAAVEIELERARQEVRRTLTLLAARRGTAALAQRAFEIATVRWTNGISTALELSDARLRLHAARVDEVTAVRDYRYALAQLEYASGQPLTLVERPLEDYSLDASDGGLK